VKVLALDLGAGFRGGQRQTGLLLSGLAARGHEILFLGRRGGPLVRNLRDQADFEIVDAPPGAESSLALLLSVARAARRFQPDLVYAGDSRAHGAVVWSRAASRRPLVVHRRVIFRPSTHPLSRAKYRVVDRFLAVSGAVARALEEAGIEPSRVAVIPDGLPAAAFVEAPHPPRPPFRLVHVGAFDGQKGQGLAVEVLGGLVARGVDATLLFLGDGPERASIEARAMALGVSPRCVFAGEVEDVPARLAASHLLLLPSTSEGAPLALLEAMAAGCPVVAHAVGGIPELTAQGTAGALVASLVEEDWEAAVAALLGDSRERERLASAGRAVAKGRTIERTVSLVEAELVSTLAASETGP
jgi:glycosyltransferase involved in cell wall biosynthesis